MEMIVLKKFEVNPANTNRLCREGTNTKPKCMRLTDHFFRIRWIEKDNARVEKYEDDEHEMMQHEHHQNPTKQIVNRLSEFPQIEVHQLEEIHLELQQFFIGVSTTDCHHTGSRRCRCSRLDVFHERSQHVIEQFDVEENLKIREQREGFQLEVTAQ